jgi:hypothetical protein
MTFRRYELKACNRGLPAVKTGKTGSLTWSIYFPLLYNIFGALTGQCLIEKPEFVLPCSDHATCFILVATLTLELTHFTAGPP